MRWQKVAGILAGPGRTSSILNAMRWHVMTCRSVAILGVLAIVLYDPSAAPAETALPGWELSATTYPASLVRGIDDEQIITPSVSAATFTLSFEGESTSPIGKGATPAAVQSALEALSTIGQHNVQVTEQLGEPGVYAIKFVEALGNTNLPELGAEEAAVSVQKKGASGGTVAIDVFNVGATHNTGAVVVTDHLPSGVKAKQAGEMIEPFQSAGPSGWGVAPEIGHQYWSCRGNGPGPANGVAGATEVTCEFTENFRGGGGMPHTAGLAEVPQPPIGIAVEGEDEAAGLVNKVSIAGGGALTGASTENTIDIGEKNQPSGITGAQVWTSNVNGTLDDQAGSHPYAMMTVIDIASATEESGPRWGYIPGGEARNLEVQLPPGFIGNLQHLAQCKQVELEKNEGGECPQASEVGLLSAVVQKVGILTHPLFNMVPPKGEPAELGFKYLGETVLLRFTVRTGGNYGITVHTDDVVKDPLAQIVTEIWGVPGDSSHDFWRGELGECSREEFQESPVTEEGSYCTAPQHPVLIPILTLPTSCGAPPEFVVRELATWTNPEAKSEARAVVSNSYGDPEGYKGCEDLAFGPTTSLIPEVSIADETSGLTAEVRPPLGGLEATVSQQEEGVYTSSRGSADIEDATVTLPPGFAINPGQANGLQSCSLSEAALLPLSDGEENDGPANCPSASRLGSVVIKTPLIEGAEEKQIEGSIYLLPSNPPEINLLVAGTADGINVKLKGTAVLNEVDGQITTTFTGTPPVPASLFKLTFDGGLRAALETPIRCGIREGQTSFTPWTTPLGASFGETIFMGVVQGAERTACPGSQLGYTPAFAAGSTTTQAGQYTALNIHLHGYAGQQRLDRFEITLPAGVTGAIAHIPLCSESGAAAGDCPASSQIGHAVVESGGGASPLVLPQPGGPEIPIYLTGPYEGAPFGLAIVTRVVAGPFNLGTVVTRAKIEVNPHTARVTAVSDPLPQILDGVPTDVRDIQVYLNHVDDFTVNPTNCDAGKYEGTAFGSAVPGEHEPSDEAGIESRSQMTACRDLTFTPKLSLTTMGHASRVDGTSLKVGISYPANALGKQAWFAGTKIDFPKQMPARLPTLQKACLAEVFEKERSRCARASMVGKAVVKTPLLPVPLEGPVYLVSYGNAKFPDAVMVLSGDNVTIELTGETFINKTTGVTSVTFRDTPDVPFESLAVTLPAGPYSEFGAYVTKNEATRYTFCGHKLTAPTALEAQNGLEIHQKTPLTLTGCKVARHTKKRQ